MVIILARLLCMHASFNRVEFGFYNTHISVVVIVSHTHDVYTHRYVRHIHNENNDIASRRRNILCTIITLM